MTAEVRRTESDAASIERVAHAFCPRCVPDPEPGQLITALCGATYPFWGRRERPVGVCPACRTLAAASVYACGHFAQSI